MADWMLVGQAVFWIVVVAWVMYEMRRKIARKPSKAVQALADEFGLRLKRNIWKGTEHWVGTWDRMPVRVTMSRTEEPSILIGEPKKGDASWMLMDRRLEADLTPLEEPAPTPTGDKAFDDRFNLRVYGAATPADLSPSMRTLLLEARPQVVTLWPTVLDYHIGGDTPSAPKARRHLEAATELARMAGITPSMAKEAAP